MRLDEWEATIQTIVDESNRDPKGLNGILMGWRWKLEKEPHRLQPFEIDEIVREVRQRLTQIGQ